MDENALALISSIEVVLMRNGNENYNLVLAKLGARYDCKIMDCYDHPEYLKTILHEVYKENYTSIINEIRLELGTFDTEEISDFINILLNP
ncbi:MAG: hypothetical protein KGI28_03180 [Thaumarchaeota archaeon]|nr:hypothetical protein [Nitrososphaerota archaeon]